MRLTLEQMIHFQTEGYVVVENVLTDADLATVIAELEEIIDGRARELMKKGKIHDLCQKEPFDRRLVGLKEQYPEIDAGLDIMEYRGKAIFEFLTNNNVLDVVECLLGSELMCNPIQHLRAKLPSAINTLQNVPWHQDAAVTTEDANDSEMITFWIPLIDATEETGCMQILPGVFKQGYLTHQNSKWGATIVSDLLPPVEPKPVPCPKGGMVIMHKLTPHRGTENRSNKSRWSIDLRYHKTGAPSGRHGHPSFVARSRSNPASVLKDHAEWSELWQEALENPKQTQFHRV